MSEPRLETVRTPVLDIACEMHGPATGEAVVLLHGFPYDTRAYDAVAPELARLGLRVVVPYLRGYGATRFLSDETPRSGQQAALAADLRDLLDALGIERAALAGYDWGGRAACIVAALWPERARCLVTCGGYNLQDIPNSVEPLSPEGEHALWYQYYFHTPRGRRGLAENRRDFAWLLWRLWSPAWRVDRATFESTAPSFDNPDFVDVVVQSYRHRFGYAEGDPAYADIEAALEAQPAIVVPTISLMGAASGFGAPGDDDPHARHFTGRYERRVLDGIGHNVPQEAPTAVLRALADLLAGA